MIRIYNGIRISKLKEKRVQSMTGNHHVYGSVDLLKQLINTREIDKKDIGILVYITQTPLFMTPSSTFYVHGELGLEQDCFQYDVNQGGTGFVTGIQLAASLLLGFKNTKKAVVLFGDNNLPNNTGQLENVNVVAILEQNQDDLLKIQNKSFGMQYDTYMNDDINGKIYHEEKCREIIKTHTAEILSGFDPMLVSGVKEMIMEDSSVRIPERLIQQKKTGETIVCTCGAGLSMAVMSCKLQPSIY